MRTISVCVYRESSTGRFLQGDLDDPSFVNLESEATLYTTEAGGFVPWHEWGAILDSPPVFALDPGDKWDACFAGVRVFARAQERVMVIR